MDDQNRSSLANWRHVEEYAGEKIKFYNDQLEDEEFPLARRVRYRYMLYLSVLELMLEAAKTYKKLYFNKLHGHGRTRRYQALVGDMFVTLEKIERYIDCNNLTFFYAILRKEYIEEFKNFVQL